jgi:hypothetical protein
MVVRAGSLPLAADAQVVRQLHGYSEKRRSWRSGMRVPDRLLTLALLQRALYLWVGVRRLVALGGGGGAGPYGLRPLPVRATGLVVLIVSFLGLLEARRRNEHVLLANFGVPQSSLAGLSALSPVLAEIVVQLVTLS